MLVSNYKFLITILSSSNVKLLKLVYNSVINQLNHNINYNIAIICNSLDTEHHTEVKNEFKQELKTSPYLKIHKSQSNGKPGMGHNSIFKTFYNSNYDYLISLDGDDFLYPYALHQISKCFINNTPDVICIYGNDTIRTSCSDIDVSDIYLTNNFYLRIGYNLPKVFSDSKCIFNPFTTNILDTGVTTIVRFLCCNKSFLKPFYNTKHSLFNLYCEECNILDDFKFYLHFTNSILQNNSNGIIINSDHIYLYNNINHNSASKTQEKSFKKDYKIISSYTEFESLQTRLGVKWDLTFIPYINLTPPFPNEPIETLNNADGTFTINKNNIITNKNYTYLIDFTSKLCIEYYNLCMDKLEYWLFTNLTDENKKKAHKLAIFLHNNHISDRKLYIYLGICYYYNNNHDLAYKFLSKSDYMIDKYPVLTEFLYNYKNSTHK